MALTPWQQDRARFDGGKDLANRKSTLARVAGSLDKLINDACAEDLADLSPKDVEILRQANGIVRKVVQAMTRDVAHAKRIQAEWESRHKLATKALLTLPHEAPADVIALAALSGNLKPSYLLRDCVEWGWQSTLRDLQLEAIRTLAHRCANQTTPPHQWVQALAAEIPAAKARNNDLIAQVIALAVANTLQRAAA